MVYVVWACVYEGDKGEGNSAAGAMTPDVESPHSALNAQPGDCDCDFCCGGVVCADNDNDAPAVEASGTPIFNLEGEPTGDGKECNGGTDSSNGFFLVFAVFTVDNSDKAGFSAGTASSFKLDDSADIAQDMAFARMIPPPNRASASSTDKSRVFEPNVGVPQCELASSIISISSLSLSLALHLCCRSNLFSFSIPVYSTSSSTLTPLKRENKSPS
ncbi:hypothetical protein CVT25_000255 [Psilocybe cyanescens]|uniref:Uncharacterized protein n=1 Tax=Psilocybe cyanescens TaxID=93625 RepID=A0A409XM46_PSICY|nr:hypothetical protein CVT25_000255 [Psilocybe cyanescens]